MTTTAGASIKHGPGAYADRDAPAERWGGRRAQEYVVETLRVYGTVCIICGLPGANSADHIIPRADGGAVYSLENLGPAHRRCNYSRGRKPLLSLTIPIENGMRYLT